MVRGGVQFKTADPPANANSPKRKLSNTFTGFHSRAAAAHRALGGSPNSIPSTPSIGTLEDGESGSVSSYSTADTSGTDDARDTRVVAVAKPGPSDFGAGEYFSLSEKNQRIVTTNIRHFLVLFYLLLFCTAIIVLPHAALLYQMMTLDPSLFSMSEIRTFLLPCLSITILISLLHIGASHLRIEKLGSETVHLGISCLFTFTHYIIMLIASGVELQLKTFHLKGVMLKLLDKWKGLQVDKRFIVTQGVRECCGIDGYKDWGWNEEISPNATKYCCVDGTVEVDENEVCDEGAIWENGCYKVEKFWISWYLGWYIGALTAGLLLNLFLFYQGHRLYKYCKQYKPYWIQPSTTTPQQHLSPPPIKIAITDIPTLQG